VSTRFIADLLSRSSDHVAADAAKYKTLSITRKTKMPLSKLQAAQGEVKHHGMSWEFVRLVGWIYVAAPGVLPSAHPLR
jgi:hypothetical protein